MDCTVQRLSTIRDFIHMPILSDCVWGYILSGAGRGGGIFLSASFLLLLYYNIIITLSHLTPYIVTCFTRNKIKNIVFIVTAQGMVCASSPTHSGHLVTGSFK